MALIAISNLTVDFLSGEGPPGLDQYSSEATISSAATLVERNTSLGIGLPRDTVTSAVYYWQILESSDKTD